MRISISTLMFLIAFSTISFSQVPHTISYQGILTDENGNFLADGNHELIIGLYENLGASSPIYTETQTVPVIKGLFNVIIGSVSPLPSSLTFDRAYFLGVIVDGGSELSPRTALTAVPYALRAASAEIADAVSPTATGVVTSINNQDGALTMQGGGGTTVTNSGSTITISSSGGGTGSGIQGVQSTDGTIGVTNPNGPVANIGLAPSSVTSDIIADGTIATADIAPGVIPSTSNFLANGTTAGGDLAGAYPEPLIGDSKVTTSKLANSAVTSQKIADNAVVKSINNLTDDVTLTAGSNVTISPSGNGLTISATSGGSSGVPSVNNISGPVTIAASGGATVNTTGNTITINAGSGGGGSGIQGVQNTNNTIDITNPNGPTATINVKDGGIGTTHIADGSVTNTKLASGIIPGSLPPNGAAGGDLDGTYPNPSVADGAITSTKLASGVLPTTLPPSGAAGGDLDGTFPNPDIADGAVTANKLALGVIPSALPPNGAAGGDLSGNYPNPTIAAHAITTDKIANAAVRNSKIADSAVTISKLAFGVIPTSLPPSGAAGGDLSGTYPNPTIAAHAITTGKIANGAVRNSKIADSVITSIKIANGTIATVDLANSSVTAAKIDGSGGSNGQVLVSNGTSVSWASPTSGGGTLDQAYDYGSAGGGRTITADAGAVKVQGVDGFLVTGTHNSGSIPATGAGTRMMFYPKKSAFRAGSAGSLSWNDANIGEYSTATGRLTTASGYIATAFGYATTASGGYSLAAGRQSTASGETSTAMGYYANASGSYAAAIGDHCTSSASSAIALGFYTTASGNHSTAIGTYVSTNNYAGCTIIGDNSTSTTLNAGIANAFYARFANGYRLFTNAATTVGVRAYANATSWSSISDSTKKERFAPSNGESFLAKFRTLRLGSWSYNGIEERHYGPMAQEWFTAFGHDGIGTIGNDTTLATADVDGVLCIAIQALEKRTQEQSEIIAKQNTKISEQEVELAAYHESLIEINTRFLTLQTRLDEIESPTPKVQAAFSKISHQGEQKP